MPNEPTVSLERALRLAVAAAVPLSGCGKEPDTMLIGTRPADLDAVCAGHLLDSVELDEPVDFLAMRQLGYIDTGGGPGDDVWSTGEACATATDPTTCADDLELTHEDAIGWSHRGGWQRSYLVTTAGDTVSLYDHVDELPTLFGALDTPAEGLFFADAQKYQTKCQSLVESDAGNWRMEAKIYTSLCPVTTEVREIEVTREGHVKLLQVLDTHESGDCIGRRPEGLVNVAASDAIGHRLARVAWLEGAAVAAFDVLAEELVRFGAPSDLVARAHQARADEVVHADLVGEMAAALGHVVPPVEVEPARSRSLLDFALENAVEGCVRETYGAAEARFAATSATSLKAQAVFSRIADDEARHAQLSRDVGRWVATQLSDAENARVSRAMVDAHNQLLTELARRQPDPTFHALGTPTSEQALAIARVLWREAGMA